MKGLVALVLLALAGQVPAWDQPLLNTAPAELELRGGALSFAGGVYLLSSSSRLGGVSGLEAQPMDDGVRFHAVTDAGDFAEFAGRLDPAGRLVSATDMTLSELRDPYGRVFPYKAAADAEDISLLPDRKGFVVAFEQNHRIVAYEDPLRPDGPQGPVEVPAVVLSMKANEGIEAISVLPGGLLAVGAEGGRIWFCPKGVACTQVAEGGEAGAGYSLTGFDHLQGSELVAVYRQRTLLRWKAKIAHIRVDAGKAQVSVLTELPDAPGNLEGITVLPRADGGWRIYAVSDNGFEATEPTVLLAFDWRG